MAGENYIREAFENAQQTMYMLKFGFGRQLGFGHSTDHINERASTMKFPEKRDFEAEAVLREKLPVAALNMALDVFIAWHAIDKGAQEGLDASVVLEMAAEFMWYQGEWN